MKQAMKSITALTVAAMLTAPAAYAQASGASSANPASSAGSGGFAPDMLAIGLGLGSLSVTDLPTNEIVRVTRALYGDIILGWYLSSYTFFQLGFFSMDGNVKSVTNVTSTSATSGDYTDWGGFLGLGIIMPLFDSPAASSAVASSSAAGVSSRTDKPVTLSAAASVGVSKRKFDAFNGSFSRSESGPFLRLEANLNIPITGNWELSPGLVFHMYDDDELESDNLRAVVRVNLRF